MMVESNVATQKWERKEQSARWNLDDGEKDRVVYTVKAHNVNESNDKSPVDNRICMAQKMLPALGC